MYTLFNAQEVFEIAVQVERNGARFYRKAAENMADEDTRRELLELAEQEDQHEQTFAEMKQAVAGEQDESAWNDPGNEAVQYLQNFASGRVFDITKDSSDFLTPDTTLREIIEYALERERDSVVFYLGVKEVVPDHLGGIQVDGIIKQEMGHIALLSKRLEQVSD